MITDADAFPREREYRFSNNSIDRKEETLGEEAQKAILAALRSCGDAVIDQERQMAAFQLSALPYLAGYIGGQIDSYLKAFPDGCRAKGNRPHALFLKALAAWSPYAPFTHCPKKCAVCGEAYWLGSNHSDLDRRTLHAAGCWVLEAEILLGINTAEAEEKRRR